METTLEALAVGGRGRRNRKWRDEVKARIVAYTLTPGSTVNAVARRYGVPANHFSAWRTLAWKGRLVLPALEGPLEFASLMIGPVVPWALRTGQRSLQARWRSVWKPEHRRSGLRRSCAPWLPAHDVPLESGADYGRDEAGRLPQGA